MGSFGRQDYHRNVVGVGVIFDALRKFVPIHAGHHHVRNNQVREFGQRQVPAFFAIGCLQNPVGSGQFSRQKTPQFGIILHNQH